MARKNIRIDLLPSDRQIASKDCRLCTRRRIKCDRSIPQCLKCGSRALRCPGFDLVPLRWGQGVASRGKLAGKAFPVLLQQHGTQEPAVRPDVPAVSDTLHNRLSIFGEVDNLLECSLKGILYPLNDLRLVKRGASAVLVDKLFDHFHREVASRLTWIDSSTNPWRSIVLPLANHSACLRLAILSLAAAHLSVTTAHNHDSRTAFLQMHHSLRDKTLRVLNKKMCFEISQSLDIIADRSRLSSLIEMLAGMLVLCYEELLIPNSTHWNLHLRACFTVIDRYKIGSLALGFQDIAAQFLFKEVVDLQAFGNVAAFAREQSLTAAVPPSSMFDDHFWTFTALLREITAVERQRYDLRNHGREPPYIDMRVWQSKLEQACALASEVNISLAEHDEHKRMLFGAVIRAHYYALLIYGYQALTPPMEATEAISSYVVKLFDEIAHITAEPTHAFSHDIFFPLFIAGTECQTNEERKCFVQGLFVDAISTTGFWCNHAALQFLCAYWVSPESQAAGGWIKYARANVRNIGPFLVF